MLWAATEISLEQTLQQAIIHEKIMAKIWGFHELFLPNFLALPKSKKNIQEITGKHALVNNNSKESITESRIMRLF